MSVSATTKPETGAGDREAELPKMTFLDHLEELRKRLLISLVAIAAGFLVCWAFAEPIFGKLQEPLTRFLPTGDKLAYTRLTAPFFLYMKVAFFAGLFAASPIVLLQLAANVASVVFVIASLHLLYINTRLLPPGLRPPLWRRVALVAMSLFYAFFVTLSVRSLL